MTAKPKPTAGPKTHPISLHIPGILSLLSDHLYSDPRVALREMIQNAHDSCQRRLVEDQLIKSYTPRININIDATNRLVIIEDNGSGLTEQEIHEYLATVGHSYTAELRERLQFGNREEALALIGQFGLGMLSAFIVAERLEMVTWSFRQNQPAWSWVSAGDETYTLGPAQRETPGSTFTLHLKVAGEFLLNEDVVRSAIRTFADFLEIPIYLNDESKPVNVMNAPWHQEQGPQAYNQFIAERFGASQPLAVIPLRDHIETVNLADGNEDKIITPIRGVLFVPTGSIVSVREFGDVSVYIRRMFITDEERELLPRWARFVRGVIDCPALRPTVSREQVRRDETFYQVQKALEAQLLAYLQNLAKTDTPAWRNIVIAHNDLIKGWALDSPAFFSAICDVVTFDTSRGRLTLHDYLEQAGGDIYYFTEERGSTQEKLLFEARGLVVIDASRFAEEAFLKVYARLHPSVQLRQLEPGATYLFENVDGPVEQWEAITRYYQEQGIQVRVVRFEPASIPAMLIYPPGSDHISEARSALEGGEISGPIAGLVEEYLRMRDPGNRGGQGILHLNADNILMEELLQLSSDHEALTAALEIVYHNARFFAGRTLTHEEARQGFDMISYSVDQLVRAVNSRNNPASND